MVDRVLIVGVGDAEATSSLLAVATTTLVSASRRHRW